MYGDDASGGLGLFGWGGFGIASELSEPPGPGVLHPQVDWLFQVAFAATAATIVSGAIVGRMQFRAYVIFSLFITAIVYPVSGFWKWGGGWLDQMGFYDFAGSVVVHAVGGFAALAAAIVLGPRIGRFKADSEARHLQGHSLALAASGVLILWVGWYGFNPGSQLAFAGAANIHATMTIAVNTTLAAGAGGVAAMILARRMSGSRKLSLAMLFNGIVVVGAWPAHGLCGVWGGIATGIFGDHDLGVQILGSLVIPAWAFCTMFALFMVLKKLGILRVSREHELAGLDLSEHGEIEGESY
jgi:Amt family ammonium transporter